MKKIMLILGSLLFLNGCALLKVPGKALDTVGIIAKTVGKAFEVTGKAVTTTGEVAKEIVKKHPAPLPIFKR